MKKFKLSLVCLTLLVAASCAVKYAGPTQKMADQCSTDLASLEMGKSLLEQECQDCHKLYRTTDFGPEQWQHIMDEMAPKAKIPDAQKDQILTYITCDIKSKK